MYLAWDPTLIWIFSYDNSIQAIVVRLCDFSLKTTHPWFQRAFYPSLIFYKLKKESTTSSSNKGAKTLYRNYLHCIENFCAILSKWIISTKQHQNFKVHVKVLSKVLKWNWWWNFTCVSAISLNFEIYFLSFTWEIVFGVISDNCFRKCKKDCNILYCTYSENFRQ